MLRAVPAIVRAAASTLAAVRSADFDFAMSRTCARVTFPTLSLFGTLLPLGTPAALRSSTEAGGVFVMKVNERSENTVITTGIGKPCSSSCVRALNCLQNSMMLTPRWPSAGPTGGLGFALPAATCSLI